jgi:hypothetical protein
MLFSSLVHAQVRILVMPSVDSKKWNDCSFPLVRLLNSQDTSLQFETFKEGITNPKLYDATVSFDISLKELSRKKLQSYYILRLQHQICHELLFQ